MKRTTLTNSLERYLEAIYILEQSHEVARVKEIAAYLQVRMPSVTGAVKNLAERGLVNYTRNSSITLTGKGKEVASGLERKHSVLACFLENVLMLPAQRARTLAWEMEHTLDEETAERLCNSVRYFSGLLGQQKDLTRHQWEEIITSKGGSCTVCTTWHPAGS